MAKKKNNVYTDEFRQEAVALINEQGYTVPEAAKSLNISPKLLYTWRDRFAKQTLDSDERAELLQLRKENKRLKMEKEILKKASAFFAKEMK